MWPRNMKMNCFSFQNPLFIDQEGYVKPPQIFSQGNTRNVITIALFFWILNFGFKFGRFLANIDLF
jgi:hypothetical protein